MGFTESVEQRDSGIIALLRRDDGFVYTTDPCENSELALCDARDWLEWYSGASRGTVETVYYIVAVPSAWAGPPDGSHRYSGLRVKIGRAKDVMRRLANLRTGTSEDLIIHALEPGSPRIEAQRHQQFASDRTHGEWFRCSPKLETHIIETWIRNNALPREHQVEVMILQERIDSLIEARRLLGGTPDMVNASLEEPWNGRVLVDLAYAGWRISLGRPLRPGAIPFNQSGVVLLGPMSGGSPTDAGEQSRETSPAGDDPPMG